MHYLLTALTFLGTFFLLIVISVATLRSTGVGPAMYLNAIVSFYIASLVYKKTKPERTGSNSLDSEMVEKAIGLSKLEQKDFTKVFTPKALQELELEIVIVTIPKAEDQDFVVHIKHHDYQHLDLDKVKKVLSKRFYHVEKMEFEELDSANIGAGEFTITASAE